jgi:CheY-like chemotaxis protein
MLKKILLIDDDFVDNYLNKQLLDQMQLAEEVTICASAQEALQLIKQEWPGLILLDINMPVMSGLEFLEILHTMEAQNHFQECPVVLLTSSIHPDDLTKAAELKADYYLVKPLTEDKIIKMMQRCFSGHRLN